MSERPEMTFSVDQLLDPKPMKDGPMDVFWNQDEWIPPTNDAIPLGDEWPRRTLVQRALRCRRWHGAVRIAPPPDTDLGEWGKGVAAKLGVPWTNEPQEGDRAVWLPMTIWARNAGQAIGSAGLVFKALDGFTVGQAAIRVWRAA